MSLIPSESYSFPDHFTSTVMPSRKPKEQPQAQKLAPRKPAIVALPDPEPQPELETFVAFEPELERAITAEQEIEPFIAADPAPEPELMAEIWEPEMPEVKAPAPPPAPARPASPPAPNPALRRAQAPPPKIQEAPVRKIALPATLKPKVRWNNRAALIDPNRNGANGNGNGAHQPQPAPAENVIPMKAARPAPPPQSLPISRPVQPQPRILQSPIQPAPVLQRPAQPVAVLQKQVQPPAARKPAVARTEARPIQPKPAPTPAKPAPVVAPASQADFFETFAEDGPELANKRRKRMKFRRFVTCEAAALLALIPLVILGLTLNISAPTA